MFYNPNKYQQRSVGATLVVAQNHDNKPETGQPRLPVRGLQNNDWGYV